MSLMPSAPAYCLIHGALDNHGAFDAPIRLLVAIGHHRLGILRSSMMPSIVISPMTYVCGDFRPATELFFRIARS